MKKLFFSLLFLFLLLSTQNFALAAPYAWLKENLVDTNKTSWGAAYEVANDALCPQPKPTGGGYNCYTKTGNALTSADTYKIVSPFDNLQVKLPNFNPTKANEIQCDLDPNTGKRTNCTFPWIGEWVAWVYQYSLGIGGILATIIMMFAGFRWMMAGGDSSAIGDAKKYISGAVAGIIILFSSYLILFQINPDLITMKPITLGIVAELETGQGCGDSCGKCEVPTTGNCSVASLKANGGDCFGADIEKMAAICNVESKGNANAQGMADGCKSSSGVISPFSFGLFQVNAVNSASGVLECKNAFSGKVDGQNCFERTTNSSGISYCKYFNCQSNANAQQCIAALQSPANNIKATCALYKSRKLQPWSKVTTKLCGF
ncbi:MAG: pilin [bacterium]